MTALVRLLGAPRFDTGGAPTPPPRGRKSWRLLAYLLLTEHPPSRQRLAALLFPEADDPLGALRWSLADLRRSLAGMESLGGDRLLGASSIESMVDKAGIVGLVACSRR